METPTVIHPLTSYNQFLLKEAVKHGDLTSVMKLLREHIDINCTDEYGRTPLHYAAEHGNYDLVRFLIFNGANVKVEDAGRVTPLHIAVRKTNKEIIKILLVFGADPNVATKTGYLPIDYCEVMSDLWLYIKDLTSKDQIPPYTICFQAKKHSKYNIPKKEKK